METVISKRVKRSQKVNHCLSSEESSDWRARKELRAA